MKILTVLMVMVMVMVMVAGLVAGCCCQHKKDQPRSGGDACCAEKTQ